MNRLKRKFFEKYNITKLVSFTAMFIGLVCIATIMFIVPIPASGGYFNFGDGFIYIAALLFGPFVGGMAGGIGSALADIISGYSQWAIGTLVIKGLEGTIVGFVFKKLRKHTLKLERAAGDSSETLKIRRRIVTMVLGLILSVMIVIIGMAFIPEGLVLWVILACILITA
ncbi:MAG: ECF transporter S component, partial [Promethearchaeota archaeon]